jgi:hypothetical protein
MFRSLSIAKEKRRSYPGSGDASQSIACSLEQFSDIIENLIDLLSAKESLPRFVFLLAEIDTTLDQNRARAFLDNSHPLFSANKIQDYVRYVLAGSSQTHTMRMSKGSPFLNILNVVLLKGIADTVDIRFSPALSCALSGMQ